MKKKMTMTAMMMMMMQRLYNMYMKELLFARFYIPFWIIFDCCKVYSLIFSVNICNCLQRAVLPLSIWQDNIFYGYFR